MGVYKDLITLPKELKTLEIDVDKKIFKLNGDDLTRCTKIDIEITPEKCSVILKANATVQFISHQRKDIGRKGQSH